MRIGKRVLAVSTLAALMATSQVMAGRVPGSQALPHVSDEVLQAIAAHVPAEQANAPRLETTTRFIASSNPDIRDFRQGMTVRTSLFPVSMSSMVWNPGTGLLEIHSEARTSGSAGAGQVAVGARSTVCGLVTVAETSTTRGNLGAMFPENRRSVPLPRPVSTEWSHSITAFEASTANICAPSPSQRFEITTRREMNVSIADGALNRSRARQKSGTMVCEVADRALPARRLTDELVGDYLPVSCVYSGEKGGFERSEYAFLHAYGIYLPLSSDLRGVGAQRHRYALASR